MSVEIKVEDEFMTLLQLLSLPKSFSGIVTTVSNSARGAKMTFKCICDLILGENVHKQSDEEASNSL